MIAKPCFLANTAATDCFREKRRTAMGPFAMLSRPATVGQNRPFAGPAQCGQDRTFLVRGRI